MGASGGIAFDIRAAYGEGDLNSILVRQNDENVQWVQHTFGSSMSPRWAQNLDNVFRNDNEKPVLLFVPDEACSEHGKAWMDLATAAGFIPDDAGPLVVLPPYSDKSVLIATVDNLEKDDVLIAYASLGAEEPPFRDVSCGALAFKHEPMRQVEAREATYAVWSRIPEQHVSVKLDKMPEAFQHAIHIMELRLLQSISESNHWLSPMFAESKLGRGGVLSSRGHGPFGADGDFRGYLEKLSLGHASWDAILAESGFGNASSVDDGDRFSSWDEPMLQHSSLCREAIEKVERCLRSTAERVRDYENLWLASTAGTPVTLAVDEVCSCSMEDMKWLAGALGSLSLLDAYESGIAMSDIVADRKIGRR